MAFTFLIAGSLGHPIAASAAPAFCGDGLSPHFAFGLADLKAAIGDTMGEPLECEHPNSANGDTLQQTSTGLAIYHQSTNTPEFTDGFNHWALAGDGSGLQAWSGDDDVASPPIIASDPRTGPLGAPPVVVADPRTLPWGAPTAGGPAATAPRSPATHATPVAPPPDPANDTPQPGAGGQTPPSQGAPGGQTPPSPTAPGGDPAPSTSGMQCLDVGSGVCVNTASDLADTLTMLRKSTVGGPLLVNAAKAGYNVHYGDLPTNVLGLFRPGRHDVTLSNYLKQFPTLDRVPVLAHELSHLRDWLANAKAMQTTAGCLETENLAFMTQSAVWREIENGHFRSPANDLERELNMINVALIADPGGFLKRLTVVYHDQCAS